MFYKNEKKMHAFKTKPCPECGAGIGQVCRKLGSDPANPNSWFTDTPKMHAKRFKAV